MERLNPVEHPKGCDPLKQWCLADGYLAIDGHDAHRLRTSVLLRPGVGLLARANR